MNNISATQYEVLFRAARRAAASLVGIGADTLDRTLRRTATALRDNAARLLEANAGDLAAISPDAPMYDRLKLTPRRIDDIACGMEQVAALGAPQGEVMERWIRPNGMVISKVRVPFGVVGVICEARPNVTLDVFALCLKTANASVVKGGGNARRTNEAAAEIIRDTLRTEGLDEAAFTLLPSEHEAADALLHAEGFVDVVIPRGGRGLIRFVRENARVPVIETGAGVVHIYFDRAGDTAKGRNIIRNAKTRRVSVCNALDCLIVHRDRLPDLPALCAPLADEKVEILADSEAFAALGGAYPAPLLKHATAEAYGTEFLGYRMALRTVGTIEEAMEHIERYTSRHSEAIITEDSEAARRFTRGVDAACVYVNLPTSFTDGGEFGFGAEIGISTQKLHARGPMGLPELTTYKYVIEGDGQTRPR